MEKSLVIQSPTKFYDVVPMFFTEMEKLGFFDKYYLATDYPDPYGLPDKCHLIHLDKDYQFATNMKKAIKEVQEDVFFICCEDHVLKGQNDLDQWQKSWDFIVNNKDVGFLRLTNNGHVPCKKDHDFAFEMKRDYKYYISLQPAIWRKPYFEATLKDGEGAWKYEPFGSKRVNKRKDMSSYCVKETVFQCTNFFKEGKFYRRQYVDYCLDNGINIPRNKKVLHKTGEMTVDEYINYREQRNG